MPADDFGPETLKRIEAVVVKLGESFGIPRDQALPIAVTEECVRKANKGLEERNKALEERVKHVADAWDAEHKQRHSFFQVLRNLAKKFAGDMDEYVLKK